MANIEFQNYFKRQIELWGEEKQHLLSKKSILIIGAGGLGSSLAFALGTVGIGKITIVDFDEVAIHNIHRQIAFQLKDIGEKKAEIVKKILISRSNFSKIKSFTVDFKTFQKENREEFDLIFDATDNLETRSQIDKFAKQLGIAWVYGSVEEFYGQVAIFKQSSFSTFQMGTLKPKGISTPIVMQIASFQANLGLKYLLEDKVEIDTLYFLSFQNPTFSISNFKLPK